MPEVVKTIDESADLHVELLKLFYGGRVKIEVEYFIGRHIEAHGHTAIIGGPRIMKEAIPLRAQFCEFASKARELVQDLARPAPQADECDQYA